VPPLNVQTYVQVQSGNGSMKKIAAATILTTSCTPCPRFIYLFFFLSINVSYTDDCVQVGYRYVFGKTTAFFLPRSVQPVRRRTVDIFFIYLFIFFVILSVLLYYSCARVRTDELSIHHCMPAPADFVTAAGGGGKPVVCGMRDLRRV
jgi:hypothetical protein